MASRQPNHYGGANLCHAFSRIVPRYEFHRNKGVMVVEDLDHTLGRHKLYAGYPPRQIQPRAHGCHPKPAFGCGYCTAMDRCNHYQRRPANGSGCYCCHP